MIGDCLTAAANHEDIGTDFHGGHGTCTSELGQRATLRQPTQVLAAMCVPMTLIDDTPAAGMNTERVATYREDAYVFGRATVLLLRAARDSALQGVRSAARGGK